MSEFRMPSLGADMDAGTLVAWHVKPGDRVKRGEVVADVETDKGIIEVEIWEDGTVESLAVGPGTKVPVSTILATLRKVEEPGGKPAAAAPAAPAPISEAPVAPGPRAMSTARPAPSPAPATVQHVRASPAAKQLARELGVDLTRLTGTGPHGSVSRADVDRAARATPAAAPSAWIDASSPRGAPSPPAPPAEPGAPEPFARAEAMRRAIAAAMARSKREIPHYYLSADVDCARAAAWLERANASRPPPGRVLFATLLLKATALALREFPELNGFFVDGSFRASAAIHVGVAISQRQGGLVAPAIHDTDRQSLPELQAALRDLVARVRAGKLRSSEMSDATLTVTNLGDQGVASVFGVIYPPQVALVGFGRLAERPWAEGGMLGVRPIVTSTLSADHRVSDGHRGALFLSAVGRLMQEPEKL